MAVIEQLVFGFAPDRDKGRQVLGSSPGLSRECADEIVRLCESWGAVPADGLRRPVLLGFPLLTRLSALPGDLHAVVRVAEGLRPIFHALVLNRADYQEFELNPFALAQEDIFLAKWDAAETLMRRELRPGSLAPLVSPPPGSGDVGFTDEAVRQMLANKRLLLPLERATSDSDRFLALVIASLPRSLRQDLRFASWSPSTANSYTLAATFRENALYTSWQPFLMTSVFGQLNESCEDYIEQVKVHLRSGDLGGLERLSGSAQVDLSRSGMASARKKSKAFTATLDRNVPPRPASPDPKTGRKSARPASAGGGQPARRPMVKPLTATSGSSRTPRPRPRPRPLRRRRRVSMRRRFAVVLSGAILLAGAWYLWTSGHWTRLPGMAGGNVRLQTDTSHGVVDIATIYQGALKGLGRGGTAGAEGNDRRRGLEILQQAGQLLEVQGHDFLDEVDQTLAGDDLDGVKPAPAARLHERGRVLARELRRLALAQVSLRGKIDWRDLSELEARDLEARFDSLLASRRGGTSLEPALTEVDHLLRSVDIRSRQVGGLARLQDLLQRDRWDEAWTRRCAAAIDDLAGVRQPRARQLRDDARLLVRLKRAEHGGGFAARSYRDDYRQATQLTPAVADVLPALSRRAGQAGEVGAAPVLLRVSADLYHELRRAADTEAPVEQRSASIRRLAENPALNFDPAIYGEHLGRLRFLLLEQTMDAGALPDSLPDVCFPTGARQDHLDFYQARREGRDAAGWRELAGRLHDPFLARWARHRADGLDSQRAKLVASFAGELAELADRRASLVQLTAAGGDATEIWRELTGAAARVSDHYRGIFAEDSAESRALARVADLAAALDLVPPAVLVGVTVRLEPDLAEEPRDVVVELRAGEREALTSDWLRLGPASPADTGWVGSGDLTWRLSLPAGAPLAVRVSDAVSGEELAAASLGDWLEEVGPRDLAGLDCGQGVRLSWRLAGSYWEDLAVPELAEAATP